MTEPRKLTWKDGERAIELLKFAVECRLAATRSQVPSFSKAAYDLAQDIEKEARDVFHLLAETRGE